MTPPAGRQPSPFDARPRWAVAMWEFSWLVRRGGTDAPVAPEAPVAPKARKA